MNLQNHRELSIIKATGIFQIKKKNQTSKTQ